MKDPHVRALAWLLDSPDLLDAQAPQWQGKVATLFGHHGEAADAWLTELDADPSALHAILDSHPFARLGRYAEQLMAFFFRRLGVLYAHGVQVGTDQTVGEFDFLLWHTDSAGARTLLHWEFATKFYLFEANQAQRQSGGDAEYLVGPNLADTLGAKMRKILVRQLSLSEHPAAQAHLPQAIDAAQALIKGWLFYRHDDFPSPATLGVSTDHCRGFWMTLDEAASLRGECFLILPRLSWLAPACAQPDACLNQEQLRAALDMHFAVDAAAVMVATLDTAGETGMALESERTFIVPNDWRGRAAAGISVK